MSFRALAQSYRVDNVTVGRIVSEVCKAIFNRFVKIHMPVPSIDDMKEFAAGFARDWQFGNMVGCVDGKHISINRPPKSGSMFFNYKNFYSIVLQAVADYIVDSYLLMLEVMESRAMVARTIHQLYMTSLRRRIIFHLIAGSLEYPSSCPIHS